MFDRRCASGSPTKSSHADGARPSVTCPWIFVHGGPMHHGVRTMKARIRPALREGKSVAANLLESEAGTL